MRKRESEDLKRFVASQENVWVEKYQTTKSVYPRRCIFFGTTNETAILHDPTGSRRWLPFECGTCNPQWVIDNRELLWAQGAAMFKASGVQYEAAERLARDVHDDFRASDPWEVQIARWLETPDFSGVAPESRNAITTSEVKEGLGIPINQQTRATEMRVGNALKALGYERTRLQIEGQRRYAYKKALR
jgi:predicted P-loop ATPase